MNALTPTPKVATGLVSGAFVTVIIWILNQCHLTVPGEVGAAMVTIFSFAASYFAPHSTPTPDQVAAIKQDICPPPKR